MWASARPSASVRARNSGLSANSKRIDFTTTGVSVCTSLARYTTPMPPSPSTFSMRYLPSTIAPLGRYRPPADECSFSATSGAPANGNPHRTQKTASAALSREHDGQDFSISLRGASRGSHSAARAGGLRPMAGAQRGGVDRLDFLAEGLAKRSFVVVVHHRFAET